MSDEQRPRRFGAWAGDPDGSPEDPTRCVEEVWQQIGPFYQCLRKRGYGERGEYCKQHAKKHLATPPVTEPSR